MKNYFILAGIFLIVYVITCVSCNRKPLPNEDIAAVVEEEIDYQKMFEEAYAQLQINEPSQRQEKQPIVLAHYMPWFQKYGFHWQEGSAKFDPAQILPDGRANIASHYYPLTGNYDSSDRLVLDYQLALMKISGIDGVIFDWYGITEGVDYKPIHEATLVMIEMIKKRGLKYAICYEDQSIKHLIEFRIITRDEGVSTARETFNWMAKNWFTDKEYIKVDSRPLVLCFGPQQFPQKSDWDTIWAGINPKPFFVELNGHVNWADASMNWSPMHLSVAGKLPIDNLVRNMNEFYSKQEQKPFVVGTALPAFHDIYAQAGGTSYGYLDYSKGETFKLTWAAAERARANIIQIQTWNDYGEGTIVEPTIERGYADLEFTQDKRAEWEPDFQFGYADLRIPIELYKIQVDGKSTEAQKQQAAAIYDLIFTGKVDELRQAMRTADIRYDFSVSPLLFNAGDNGAQVVRVFDPAGRQNLALGKPVVASSRIDVYTPNRATDGDAATYWEGAAQAWPGILQVDLVYQTKISTLVIKLNPQRMWSARTQRFEVKTGNDGENWTTAVPESDYVFDPATNANTVVIPVNITAQYIQLVFTANSGATNGQVAEIEVYGE